MTSRGSCGIGDALVVEGSSVVGEFEKKTSLGFSVFFVVGSLVVDDGVVVMPVSGRIGWPSKY